MIQISILKTYTAVHTFFESKIVAFTAQFPLKIITRSNLYSVAILFILLTISLIFITYFYLSSNKKTFFYKQKIREQLDEWISTVLLDEEFDVEEKNTITASLKQLIKNPIAEKFIMEELVGTKKSFTGTAANNIVELYLDLGLKVFSLKKLANKKWHIKAKGIQELYVMDQYDLEDEIHSYTNSENEFIRMEAQVGNIHLRGFKGLKFLNTTTNHITDWQQIKLLNQLSLVQFEEMHTLADWIESENDSIVILALKIVEIYQQFQVYREVELSLYHHNEKIRNQAVKTIVRIAKIKTANTLVEIFKTEILANQLNILDHLPQVANDNHIGFLLLLQNHGNNLIKLKAAKALTQYSTYGLAALETRSILQPEPYKKIFLHVLSEMDV